MNKFTTHFIIPMISFAAGFVVSSLLHTAKHCDDTYESDIDVDCGECDYNCDDCGCSCDIIHFNVSEE